MKHLRDSIFFILFFAVLIWVFQFIAPYLSGGDDCVQKDRFGQNVVCDDEEFYYSE
jgi:hypothetical protein